MIPAGRRLPRSAILNLIRAWGERLRASTSPLPWSAMPRPAPPPEHSHLDVGRRWAGPAEEPRAAVVVNTPLGPMPAEKQPEDRPPTTKEAWPDDPLGEWHGRNE